MRYLLNSVYAVCILIALGTAAVWFGVQIPGLQAYDIKIVQSGSMEPAISTGSVVLIQARDQYAEGDVVTFASSQTDSIPTTHRIIEQYQERGSTWFVTQGDANEAVDAQPVSEGMIIGRVVASVPFIGYVFDFARQPMGFALLIVLPALLIIYGELEIIWRELRRRRTVSSTPTTKTAQTQQSQPRVSEEPVRMMDINRPIRYRYHAGHTLDIRALLRERQTASQLAIPASASAQFLTMGMLLVGGMMLLSGFASVTMSYFSDSTVATGTFQAGQFAPEPPEPFAFSVSPESVCYGSTVQNRPVDESFTYTLMLTPPSSDVLYDVDVQITEDTGNLCQRLEVEATTAPLVPKQDLVGYSETGLSIDDSWTLRLTTTGNLGRDNACEADIIFTARNAGQTITETATTSIRIQHGTCPATTETLQSTTAEVGFGSPATAGMSTALDPAGDADSGAETEKTEEDLVPDDETLEPLTTPEDTVLPDEESALETESEAEEVAEPEDETTTVSAEEQSEAEDALAEAVDETDGVEPEEVESTDTEEVVDGDVVEEDLEEDQSTPEDEVVPEEPVEETQTGPEEEDSIDEASEETEDVVEQEYEVTAEEVPVEEV